MFKQITKKIINKKWLTICLVLGLSVLVATLSCHPMFREGSIDKMINRLFADYVEQYNSFPAVVGRDGVCDAKQVHSVSVVLDDVKKHQEQWDQQLQLPVVESQTNIYLRELGTVSTYSKQGFFYRISHMPNLPEHIQILFGEDYDSYTGEGIPCVISESVMDQHGLVVGEEVEFISLHNDKNQALKLIVAGIFKEKESRDYFWYEEPNQMEDHIYISQESFDEILSSFNYACEEIYYKQHVLLDYTKVNHKNADDIADGLEKLRKADEAFSDTLDATLKQYQQGKKTINITLWVLEIPILGMVLAYIYMVSCQIIETEKNEIAMLKSRGVSRGQVISMYALQSLLLSLMGLVSGLPLGYILYVLGASTTDFLSFSVKGLILYPFEISMIGYGLLAVLLGIVFILLPVLSSSKTSIVEVKSTANVAKKALWEKFFVDFVLLGISIYLLYSFNQNIENIRMNALDGQKMDPMIFLNSVIFIIALGLVVLRLTHYLVKLVYAIGRKKWKPAMYASFLQITRTFGKQGFISVFLVLTVAMGLFDANIARTINKNNVERITYNIGADVLVSEKWIKKLYTTADKTIEYEYIEPDYVKYEALKKEGLCESMTRVVYDPYTEVRVKENKVENCMLQGIHTKEFGETAILMDDLNKDVHWYTHLNKMAAYTNGVIISRNLADKLGVKEGDGVTITRFDILTTVTDITRGEMYGKVCAIVDAWPGYNQYYYEDGELKENYLVVANYATVYNVFKVSPYKVWMKLPKDVSVADLEKRMKEMEITNLKLESVENDVEDMRNSSIIQITNGMFTLSFIIAIVLCAVGFMIYWISSIRQRELLFGVYRAMGMTVKEINQMLINEHIFSTLLSVVAGGMVGIISTVLFFRLFGVVYLPQKHNIDIFLHCEMGDMIKLALVVGLMIFACIMILRKLIKSMNITQALKLGED